MLNQMVNQKIQVEILNSKTLNPKRYLELWNRNEVNIHSTDDDNIVLTRFVIPIRNSNAKKFSVLSWPMKSSSSFSKKHWQQA